MKLNKEQKRILLFGIVILSLLFFYHTQNPYLFSIGHLIIYFILWISIFWGYRTTRPTDLSFHFKKKVIELLKNGICPFCEKNQIGDFRIRVGYSKLNQWINLKIFYIEYNKRRDEYITSVSICDKCKDRYLNNKLSNPSSFVLEHKNGFSTSLKYPLSPGNIYKPEK